jgi:hypothetical protein
MKKTFLRFPDDMSQQARNAFLIAALLAIPHFAAALYYLYLGWVSGSVQFYAVAAISLTLGVLFVISAMLSRRGRPAQGTILVLGALAVSYPPIALLLSGLGLVLGIALMVAGPLIASLALSHRSSWVMGAATVISGLATFLLDAFGSTMRPPLPGIFIQLLAVSVVGVLIFFIFRQFRSYPLRTKLIIVLVTSAIASVGTVAFLTNRSLNSSLTDQIGNSLSELASAKAVEIGQAVERESDVLKALAFDKAVQDAAQAASQSGTLSQAEIDRLDQQWQAADAADNNADPLVASVLSNKLSSDLRRFRKTFPNTSKFSSPIRKVLASPAPTAPPTTTRLTKNGGKLPTSRAFTLDNQSMTKVVKALPLLWPRPSGRMAVKILWASCAPRLISIHWRIPWLLVCSDKPAKWIFIFPMDRS